ncbi:MAG TPA: hypothetical protein VME40_15105 [Caulobacteraceae bacterium]|nr:hypothetical protein [Caulobacteraceae bacterium]
MRTPLLAAFCLSCLGAPAMADGPIATSNPAQAPAPMQVGGPPPLTRDDSADSFGAAPARVIGPCGPTQATPDGRPDATPHGEVSAGVGTDGYRQLSAVVCKPLGAAGSLTIGAGTTQFGSLPPPRR